MEKIKKALKPTILLAIAIIAVVFLSKATYSYASDSLRVPINQRDASERMNMIAMRIAAINIHKAIFGGQMSAEKDTETIEQQALGYTFPIVKEFFRISGRTPTESEVRWIFIKSNRTHTNRANVKVVDLHKEFARELAFKIVTRGIYQAIYTKPFPGKQMGKTKTNLTGKENGVFRQMFSFVLDFFVEVGRIPTAEEMKELLIESTIQRISDINYFTILSLLNIPADLALETPLGTYVIAVFLQKYKIKKGYTNIETIKIQTSKIYQQAIKYYAKKSGLEEFSNDCYGMMSFFDTYNTPGRERLDELRSIFLKFSIRLKTDIENSLGNRWPSRNTNTAI